MTLFIRVKFRAFLRDWLNVQREIPIGHLVSPKPGARFPAKLLDVVGVYVELR